MTGAITVHASATIRPLELLAGGLIGAVVLVALCIALSLWA